MSEASVAAPTEPAYPRVLVFSRVFVLVLVHLLGFATVFAVAFALRFDFSIPPRMVSIFWMTIPWVAAVKLTVFCLTGNFFGWWRYVTFADLTALLRASTLSTLIVMGIDYLVLETYQIPRSVLLMDLGFTVLLFGGLRSSIRFSREHFWPIIRRKDCSKAIFVGADEFGAILASRIHTDSRMPYRVVGFVDADASKRGSRLSGIPVLGHMRDIREIAHTCRAQHVLVMSGSLTGQGMRELMKSCEAGKLTVKVLPGLSELLKVDHRIHLRDVDINDLLRRDPVYLDSEAISDMLRDKCVMVTGAGGSIGSEICRQVLRFQPQTLVLIEKAENSLFHIERELRSLPTQCGLFPCIADILDSNRMNKLFSHFRPDVVFHAAAHKQVPLMEYNIGEAIKNNVFGTKRLADLAHEFGVQSFVLISTDKAVNPSSVMGVSKQLAERYVHALSQESESRFVVVRFGNVLGSAGSVVPIFQEQIRQGGPITVTDPRMTRYFMTIPEASQLVLQASAMGRGGEIFVLDMGEPVLIVDLARELIRLSGLTPDDIDIVFTGIRPGEKLYEELYFEDEETLPTAHIKVRAAYHRPYDMDEVKRELAELVKLVDAPNELICHKLRILVPEYLNGSGDRDRRERLTHLEEESEPKPISG